MLESPKMMLERKALMAELRVPRFDATDCRTAAIADRIMARREAGNGETTHLTLIQPETEHPNWLQLIACLALFVGALIWRFGI